MQKLVAITVAAVVVAFCFGVIAMLTSNNRSEASYDGLFMVLTDAMFYDSEELAALLDSSNPDTQRSGLHYLEKRRDPAGRERALVMLDSVDDYIWFNAAQYLAAIGEDVSVPYLIKGLDHRATRSYPQVADYLTELTGVNLGQDQEEWMAWWCEMRPESDFNFTYASRRAAALEVHERIRYAMFSAIDPLRVRLADIDIRLVGVRLRAEADEASATRLLNQAVAGGFARLLVDAKPLQDDTDAVRCLAIYEPVGLEHENSMLRRGLGARPFSAPTLLNAWLLESELYEPDPAGVNDPRLLEEIISEAGIHWNASGHGG